MKNKMRCDARHFHTRFWYFGLCFTLLLIFTVGCNTFTQGTEPAIPWSPVVNPQNIETLLPTAVETLGVGEISSPIWEAESAPADCEDRPLAAWRFQPGTYTMQLNASSDQRIYSHIIDQYIHLDEMDLSSFTPDNEYPSVSNYCSYPANGFGAYIPQPPTPGLVHNWEGTCTQQSEVPRSVSQKWTSTVMGYEDIETNFGTITALKIESINEVTEVDGIDGTSHAHIDATSWFVCGMGLVYEESTYNNLTTNYIRSSINQELLSFSPITTHEDRVRYILADIELGQTADYYRANMIDEETAEALRRWDAGIRVVNFDKFERLQFNGQWQIIDSETGQPADGNLIILTSDQ